MSVVSPWVSRLRSALGKLGPGVIAGVANDDPSCIVTFSVAGARFGYATLWTSLYMLPLLAAIQLLSARLGIASGRGLAGNLKTRYPRPVLWAFCGGLLAANILTLGADLGGMAEVAALATGVPTPVWVPVFAVGIVGLLFLFPYTRLVTVCKWLSMVLFAYVAAGLLAAPDWGSAIRATLLPAASSGPGYAAMLVAIVGATLSPYLLVWQSAQEVESEYCIGRRTVGQRRGATSEEIGRATPDVFTGAAVAKAITYFITLAVAATAHGAAIRGAKDAAAALAPVAGPWAFALFAIGVVGTGILSIPALAASSAYAISESFRWKASLQDPPRHAPKFYAVLALATALGGVSMYLGFTVVEMLVAASLVNGILTPVVIYFMLRLTGNPNVMAGRPAGGWLMVLGWAGAALAAFAVLSIAFLP